MSKANAVDAPIVAAPARRIRWFCASSTRAPLTYMASRLRQRRRRPSPSAISTSPSTLRRSTSRRSPCRRPILPSGVFDCQRVNLPRLTLPWRRHDARARGRRGQNFTLLTTGGALAAKAAPLPAKPNELAAANLTGTLATNLSLALERHYVRADHGVQMRFELTNKGSTAIEVGAGAAMVFDTMAAKQRDLDGMAGNCSFVDPAICGEGGWVSATRMTGTGGVLLVVPEEGIGVQAWRLMRESSVPWAYELTSLSKAWAEDEWKDAKGAPWVPPASLAPRAGSDRRLHVPAAARAPSIREKDDALAAAGFAVVQAVPSWTIATDMRNATLHVLPPRGGTIKTVDVAPAPATRRHTAADWQEGLLLRAAPRADRRPRRRQRQLLRRLDARLERLRAAAAR